MQETADGAMMEHDWKRPDTEENYEEVQLKNRVMALLFWNQCHIDLP